METPSLLKRDDFGRHRASSDPLSRGGSFLDGAGVLNQEPNPFEQSFGPLAGSSSAAAALKATDGSASASGRRARSTSPSSLMPRTTPGGSQRLPPLSLMETPGGGELSAFGWGVDSLRTGPLSPALLNGPTGTSGLFQSASVAGGGATTGTGLTPFTAGFVGAGAAGAPPSSTAGATTSAGVSFPPPSPATAALFAMMTNNTPGTSDAAASASTVAAHAGGGPRPHEGPNEANSFEASFARANSDNLIATGSHKRTPHEAALHRSALQNQMNGIGAVGSAPAVPQVHSLRGAPPPHHLQQSQQGQQPPPPGGGIPSSAAFVPPPQHAASSYYGPAYPTGAPPPPPHSGYAPPPPAPSHNPSTGAPPPAANAGPPPPGSLHFTAPPRPQNPLDLLTAASNYNDDTVVAAAALSGLATPGGGFPAAAILAAQQQAQQVQAQQQAQQQQQQQQHHHHPQHPHVISGGMGVMNGAGRQEGSPAPSGANGRGKRGASAQLVPQQNPSPQQQQPPAKRARKQTAAAAAAIAAEAGGLDYDEDEDMQLGGAGGSGAGAPPPPAAAGKKAAGKKGGRKGAAAAAAAAAAAKKEEAFDDGASVGSTADGDMGMYGYDDMGGDGYGGEGSQPPESQPKKGGRGRKKDSGETEEEKRKNFLERNRQAALKCRQRKKAWLQSLQTKVELLTTDNDTLQSTVNNLKEEVHSLRSILAAHANCPVALGNQPPTQQQQQQHPHGPPPPHMQHRGMPGSLPPGLAPSTMPPQGYAPAAQY